MQMQLMEHLDELRTRLTRSVSVVMIAFVLLMFKAQALINFLKIPLVNALPPGTPALHFTGPMDVMFVGMKVAFMAAVIVTSPFWLREFWKFFEPGLYAAERKYVLPFIWGSVALFLSGIAFCYFVALPYTLGFLITIGIEVGVPIITVTDYVGLLILLFTGFGLVFETPLILVLLSLLDVIDSKTLTSQRRIALVVILIIAAFLTPGPDPISQFVMAIPLYGLFELSILIIQRLEKNRALKAKTSGGHAGTIATMILIFGTLAFFAIHPEELRASEPDTKDSGNAGSFWTFGTGIASYNLETESIHSIKGRSARISIGHDTGGKAWSLATSFDLIMGPYAPVNPGHLRRIDMDFNGSGVTMMGYYRLKPSNDSPVGSVALLAGVSYLDLTGRSLGGGFERDFVLAPVASSEAAADPVQVLDNYKLKAARFSAITGIAWNANWGKARTSNQPSDLKTRVDGYKVSLWTEVPFISNYTSQYDLVTASDQVQSQTINDRGSLSGYSIVLQATALLGS